MSWVLMICFLSLLGCCVGLWLGSVLAFWSVLTFGCESGLPPLRPKKEKQFIRNFTFYISVNDSIYSIIETRSPSFSLLSWVILGIYFIMCSLIVSHPLAA